MTGLSGDRSLSARVVIAPAPPAAPDSLASSPGAAGAPAFRPAAGLAPIGAASLAPAAPLPLPHRPPAGAAPVAPLALPTRQPVVLPQWLLDVPSWQHPYPALLAASLPPLLLLLIAAWAWPS